MLAEEVGRRRMGGREKGGGEREDRGEERSEKFGRTRRGPPSTDRILNLHYKLSRT